MKLSFLQNASKLTIGIFIGALLCGGSAMAYNNYISDNTPTGGYLLCANKKTGQVTYPNKLSCPAGTTALDLGAVAGTEGPQGEQGPEGPQGVQGPQGPAGSSSNVTNYYKKVLERDIVVDGVITTSANLKKVVMGSVTYADLPFGYYRLDAHLSGTWSDSVFNSSSSPMLQCYFQSKSDYDSGSSSRQWGAARIDYVNWTGINFNIQGYAWFLNASDSPVYLVCQTSGSIKQFGGMIEALSASSSIPMKNNSTSGTVN